jgi:hypothetical protein
VLEIKTHTFICSAVSPGSEKSATQVICGAKQSPDSGYVSSRGSMAMLDSPGFSDSGKYLPSASAGRSSESGPFRTYLASLPSGDQQGLAGGPNHIGAYVPARCSLDGRDGLAGTAAQQPPPPRTSSVDEGPRSSIDTVLDGRKFLGGLEGPDNKTVENFVKQQQQQQHQQQQLEHQRTSTTTAAMNLALPGMYIRCTCVADPGFLSRIRIFVIPEIWVQGQKDSWIRIRI